MSYFTQMLTAQTHSLSLPESVKERAESFVLQGSPGATPEQRPFRRMLDFWAVCIGYAVARGLDPAPADRSSKGRKFVDTRSVEMPDALCELLAVIAFAELGPEHEDLDRPAAIIDIANRYAAAGADRLLELLESPDFKVTTLDRVLDIAGDASKNSVVESDIR